MASQKMIRKHYREKPRNDIFIIAKPPSSFRFLKKKDKEEHLNRLRDICMQAKKDGVLVVEPGVEVEVLHGIRRIDIENLRS